MVLNSGKTKNTHIIKVTFLELFKGNTKLSNLDIKETL